MRKLLGVSLSLALGPLLAACGSTEPSRFYLLTPAEPADEVPARAPADVRVRLAPVDLPAYLDQPELVTRAGNRIELAEYDRWAEPLDRGFSRVLAEDLARLVPTDHVLVAPWQGRSEGERVVHVQVDRFDVEAGEAVLAATWSVADRMTDPGTPRRFRIVRELEGEGPAAAARALSLALAALAEEIAGALRP